MELTFVTELGQSFVVEIDPNMELENVMALLEAEVRPLPLSAPAPQTHISSLASLSASRVSRMRAATSVIPKRRCTSAG